EAIAADLRPPGLQLARRLRIFAGVGGAHLARAPLASGVALDLARLVQQPQALALFFERQPQHAREPTLLVPRQRPVLLELERAQDGVRPGALVSGAARLLQARPALGQARDALGVDQERDEIEQAQRPDLDQLEEIWQARLGLAAQPAREREARDPELARRLHQRARAAQVVEQGRHPADADRLVVAQPGGRGSVELLERVAHVDPDALGEPKEADPRRRAFL